MIRVLAALLLAAIAVPACAAGTAFTEIGATAGVDSTTGNSAAWRHQKVIWQRRETDSASYYAGAGHDERFDLNDTYVTGGFHLPASRKWSFNGALNLSPQHNFLPRDSLFAAVDYTIRRGWILHAGLRHSRYQDSQSNVATLGAIAYVGAWRFAYTLFEGTSSGASGASHLVQADWYYGDISFVGLGLVKGREVERIDPRRLVVTPVTGVSLRGKQAISGHWAVTYTLGVTSLQDFYTRRGISIGVAYRY